MEHLYSGILYICKNSKKNLCILWEVLQEILQDYTIIHKHDTFYKKWHGNRRINLHCLTKRINNILHIAFILCVDQLFNIDEIYIY